MGQKQGSITVHSSTCHCRTYDHAIDLKSNSGKEEKMKKTLLTGLLLCLMPYAQAATHVSGYYKSNGTYV